MRLLTYFLIVLSKLLAPPERLRARLDDDLRIPRPDYDAPEVRPVVYGRERA